MAPKSFSIGVLDEAVHEFRRVAEDKLAPCFELPDRHGVNKVHLYERFWIEVATAEPEAVRKAVAILRGEHRIGKIGEQPEENTE